MLFIGSQGVIYFVLFIAKKRLFFDGKIRNYFSIKVLKNLVNNESELYNILSI